MKFVCGIYLNYNFSPICVGIFFDDDGIMFYVHNNLDFLISEVTLTVRGRIRTTQ